MGLPPRILTTAPCKTVLIKMSIYDFDFVQAIDGQIRISGIMRLRVIEQLAESLPPMWDWVGSTQYGGKNYTFQAIFDTFDK